TLTNVTVTDPKVTVSGGPLATQAAGAVDNTTFTADYVITAADVTAGSVSNQATASGVDPNNNTVTGKSDDGITTNGSDNPTVTPVAGGSIAIIKTATVVDTNADGIKGNAGDHINYHFAVTNTGSVALTNVTVTDPLVTVAGGPLATLAAGAVDNTTFTADYVITAADVTAGSVSNQATATGKDPNGNTVSDLSDGSSNTGDNPTITPVNDVPVAVTDVVSTNEDTPLNGSVTGNDTPSGDGGNVWSKTTDPTHGSLVFNPDGTYTYTPNANYNGPDSFTYTITDADGDTSTATVTINVVSVNDVPVAVNDVVSTNEDTPLNGSVTGNDTPSGDGGNVWSKTTDPTHGSLV
ncbi:MAG: cadherin-like domain-containing protein, partial [Paludibacter sp.]|nr:cadherin-like domain-containing protein [Paludibacter sp.]